MKKIYSFIALALVVALSAKAQVNSIVDLFGKYHFTADIEVTEFGKTYESSFSNDCEVTFTWDDLGIYEGRFINLAGATADDQHISYIDTDAHTLTVVNPNGGNYYVWSKISMANEFGDYPYSINAEQRGYNTIKYTYDPDTKTIYMPDFTFVKAYFGTQTCDLVATVRNAKLELVEPLYRNVDNLEGTWEYSPAYFSGDDIPHIITFELVKTGDSNREYNAIMQFGDYTVTLPATFDSNTLVITFDDTYLDADKTLALYDFNLDSKQGTIEFHEVNSKSLKNSNPFAVGRLNADGDVETVQYWMDGSAKKADTRTYEWAGYYTVKAHETNVQTNEERDVEFPMEIKEDGGYYMTTFWSGMDELYNNTYGGLTLTLSGNELSATFSAGQPLQAIEAGVLYYYIFDGEMSDGKITMSVNEDASGIDISEFVVGKFYYDLSGDNEPIYYYTNVTAAKSELPDAISSTPAAKASASGIYTISGTRVAALQKGLNIVKDADGSVKKILVK